MLFIGLIVNGSVLYSSTLFSLVKIVLFVHTFHFVRKSFNVYIVFWLNNCSNLSQILFPYTLVVHSYTDTNSFVTLFLRHR